MHSWFIVSEHDNHNSFWFFPITISQKSSDRPESKLYIYNSVYITYEENDKRLEKYFGSIAS
jgi:hypothetical protein